MLSESLLSVGRSLLGSTFCNSTGQLLAKGSGQDAAGYPTGAWANEGSPFKCCLYAPKGNEVPEPLALINREIFWLAYEGSPAVESKKRVVIDGTVYHVHTSESERTNAFLLRAMVSRLGPYIDAKTGYPAHYEEHY